MNTEKGEKPGSWECVLGNCLHQPTSERREAAGDRTEKTSEVMQRPSPKKTHKKHTHMGGQSLKWLGGQCHLMLQRKGWELRTDTDARRVLETYEMALSVQ